MLVSICESAFGTNSVDLILVVGPAVVIRSLAQMTARDTVRPGERLLVEKARQLTKPRHSALQSRQTQGSRDLWCKFKRPNPYFKTLTPLHLNPNAQTLSHSAQTLNRSAQTRSPGAQALDRSAQALNPMALANGMFRNSCFLIFFDHGPTLFRRKMQKINLLGWSDRLG